MKALLVTKLSKYYGKLCAVSSVSFSVNKGEVFGILGPNGAGKTTTLEMIEGLIKIDSGDVSICNLDIKKDYKEIKQIIGVQLQSTFIYDKIKLYEILSLFASYYKRSYSIDYILNTLSLADKRQSYFENLSGGQKQRLSLGLAMINDPLVLFLDEPTAGVDPHARRNIWSIIGKMRDEGKSIILTTHHMEEAEHLCDRVAIMNKGRIIDIDNPKKLIEKHKLSSSIHFPLNHAIDDKDLQKLDSVIDIKSSKTDKTLFTKKPMQSLDALISLAKSKNTKLNHITLKEPNLEDLFLELTGRDLVE